MPKRFLLIATAITLLALVPTATAAWSTSASVPGSFRPNRAVTFTYTAASSSGLDLGVSWSVDLLTCVDSNADGICTSGTDANYHDLGAKPINVAAGASGVVSWSVNLPDATGPHTYNFNPTCAIPCTGQAPATGDTKHGTFQLAYTNSWTRTVTVPSFVGSGATAAVMYNLVSTSPDDQDLTGTAQLYTTANSSVERAEGPKPVAVSANAQQTLLWPAIAFAPPGRQQERVTDSTTSAQAFGNASVLAVQFNVTTPRTVYTTGSTVGLYVVFAGRGATPDWQPLQANVQMILRNGTFALSNTTLRTDANGTAYEGFQAANDLAEVNWTANTTITWNGIAFAPSVNGTIDFTMISTGPDASVIENLTAIRNNLTNVSFQGVHLDTLGTHNLLLEIGRVTLYASLAASILLLIVYASLRV